MCVWGEWSKVSYSGIMILVIVEMGRSREEVNLKHAYNKMELSLFEDDTVCPIIR